MALGAAVACPDRPVIGIQADGSAMYTISALWSYAREQADITTIVCDNGSYAILEHELSRVGAASDGKRAGQLLDLGGPALDFVALATGHGRAGHAGDDRRGAGRPAAARARRARTAPHRRHPAVVRRRDPTDRRPLAAGRVTRGGEPAPESVQVRFPGVDPSPDQDGSNGGNGRRRERTQRSGGGAGLRRARGACPAVRHRRGRRPGATRSAPGRWPWPGGAPAAARARPQGRARRSRSASPCRCWATPCGGSRRSSG